MLRLSRDRSPRRWVVSPLRLLTAAALTSVVVACGNAGKDGAASGTQPAAGVQAAASSQPTRAQLPPEVAAQLDSGNVAFRAKEYEAARTHYREAARLAPHVTAAWYGVYMVEKTLGNEAAADTAMAWVRRLSPGQEVIHPTVTDSVKTPG